MGQLPLSTLQQSNLEGDAYETEPENRQDTTIFFNEIQNSSHHRKIKPHASKYTRASSIGAPFASLQHLSLTLAANPCFCLLDASIHFPTFCTFSLPPPLLQKVKEWSYYDKTCTWSFSVSAVVCVIVF
jgi:hypothetical protein